MPSSACGVDGTLRLGTTGMTERIVHRHRGYPTLPGYWERFYRDDPELYDRFALSSVHAVAEMDALFGFADTNVLVLSAGTGRDAFEIAARARSVVGIEPSAAMREYAIHKQRRLGVANLEFLEGVGEDLSHLPDDSFDRVVSVHGVPFPEDAERAVVRGCLRVVRRGGHIAFVSTTPGWQMDHERTPPRDASAAPDFLEEYLGPFGFRARDVVVEMDYGSVDEALATWGYIYGEEAIDYLLDRRTSRLTWSLRIWHRGV